MWHATAEGYCNEHNPAECRAQSELSPAICSAYAGGLSAKQFAKAKRPHESPTSLKPYVTYVEGLSSIYTHLPYPAAGRVGSDFYS